MFIENETTEKMRSVNQDLTFETAKKEFSVRGLDFGEPQMKTLGLINAENMYTNLALLLSDQCPHIIKSAMFGGTGQEKFQDRKEFEGSLLKQLNDAYAYLDMRNKTEATFSGLLRTDKRDYPETALREALLNSIVHRDYSFSASTLISIYSDRAEFVSIGGLANGVSMDDVMFGISVCRNPALANVFYRLKLIEAYGTGLKKIMESYLETDKKPQILSSTNAFKVILPNCNYENQ